MKTTLAFLASTSRAGLAMAKPNDEGAAVDESIANETAIEDSAAADGKLNPLLEKEKVQKLKAALGTDRVFFESDESGTAFEKASAKLEEVAGVTESFFGLTLMVREGEGASSIQNADRICVATVGIRDKETKTNGYKAIVAFEAPSVEAFLANETEAARNWIGKLIEREATDVAFQSIRGAGTVQELETAVLGVPASVDDIVTTSRESGGLDTDAFDMLWQPFRVGILRPKQPKVEAALPTKPDMVKAIRSKSYALANPKTRVLEEAGIFVKIAAALVKLAPTFKDSEGKPSPVDATSITEWLEGRDSLELGYKEATVSADDLAGIDF